MTIAISDLLSPQTPDQYLAKMLTIASGLGLTTTTWQPGDPTLTLLETWAQVLGVAAGTAQNAQGAYVSGQVATITAGGFLDLAADPAVTPDPSVQNSDGTYPTGGWLDLIAQYVFETTRNAATRAASSVTVSNATSTTYGPFGVGTYHVANPVTGKTYSNTSVLTIAPAAGGPTTTTFVVSADQAGAASTSGANTITQTVTSLAGVTISASTAATGANAESNTALVTRCRAKWSTLAIRTGTGAAFTYYALTTTETGYPTLSSAITRVAIVADKASGIVTVYLAGSSGGTSAPDAALMQTYLANTAASDVESVTCTGAGNITINTSMTVFCPASYISVVGAAVQAAVQAYIASLPIGGVLLESPGPGGNGVSFNGLEDYVARAVPYIRSQSTTLNGGTASINLLASQVAVAGTITVFYGGA